MDCENCQRKMTPAEHGAYKTRCEDCWTANLYTPKGIREVTDREAIDDKGEPIETRRPRFYKRKNLR